MFKNILIPISSEFYSKEVLKRSIFLAKKFNSKINLIYIIEEKTLNQTDKKSDSYRTTYEIAETKKQIRLKQKQTADQIVFEDAKSGVEAAKKANMLCIGVDRVDNPELLHRADLVVSDLETVAIETIEALFNAHAPVTVELVSEGVIDDISHLLQRLGINHSKHRTSKKKENEADVHRIVVRGNERVEKWKEKIGFNNEAKIMKYLIWKKFGFCPANTNINQRRLILRGELDPRTLYDVD